jgi:hypothetical protein
MDGKKVKAMRVAINEALALVAEGVGDITLKLGNVTFSDSGFKGSILCEETTLDGVNKKYESDWKQAVSLGIVKEYWLGVITESRSGSVKVIGYDFNRPKNCIILKGVNNGKIYLTTMRHFNHQRFSTPAPLLDDADRGEKILNLKDLSQEGC